MVGTRMGAFVMCYEADIPADDLADCCPKFHYMRSEVFQVMMEDLDKEQRLRFIAVRLIFAGFIKPKRIAQHFGFSLRMVNSWVGLMRREGLDAAVDAAVAPKRRGGRLPRVYGGTLEAMREGVESNRWKSGAQVRVWLREDQGVLLTLAGTFYWLHKLGWSARKSRPHN